MNFSNEFKGTILLELNAKTKKNKKGEKTTQIGEKLIKKEEEEKTLKRKNVIIESLLP